MNTRISYRVVMLMALMIVITVASTQLKADTGTCGGSSITLPFTDVPSSNIFFCSIAEAYFSALTNGTSATTYSPGDPVPREQMAAFVTRTLDQSLTRGSQRAALDQFWTTKTASNLALTTLGSNPTLAKSDGAALWVANGNSVSRVRTSDGKLLETWTGAASAYGVLVAMGKVFITGSTDPGSLYQIDPTQAPGAVTTLTSGLGSFPEGIAYDGERIWIANAGDPRFPGTGSVSIVTFNPLSVATVTTGLSRPAGIIYDGTNIWVTDDGDNNLKKLDSNGNVLMSVAVGSQPSFPAFDGTNIWVGHFDAGYPFVTVVRATGGLAGTVIQNLSFAQAFGFANSFQAAFDGERILVTTSYFVNSTPVNSVSLWKASDLTFIGTFHTGVGTVPFGACSDGLNFWVTLSGTGKVARF